MSVSTRIKSSLTTSILVVLLIAIIIIVMYFQKGSYSDIDIIKKRYRRYEQSPDQFHQQLEDMIKSRWRQDQYQSRMSFLEDDTIYIDSSDIDFAVIFCLFSQYPNINYVVWYPKNMENIKIRDPVEIVRTTGDAYLSFLYLRAESKYSRDFVVIQRSIVAMQILFNQVFYPNAPPFIQDFVKHAILTIDSSPLPYIRTYMAFIFIDVVSAPQRKYAIADRHLDPNIPTLFQTWVSRNTDVQYLYSSSESFKRDYPSFNYRLFDDQDMKRFIRKFYPQAVIERYDSILPSAFRSDFFRYLYLYRCGGMYFDITLQSHQPLTRFVDIDDYDFISPIDMGSEDTSQLYQAFMYAKKNHPYMKDCIDRILAYKIQDMPRMGCLSYTGPKLIGSVVNSNPAHSRNLFLRHVDYSRIVIDNHGCNDNTIFFTRGHFPDQNISKEMYSESQKQHYSTHCVVNNIFYY